MTAEIEILPGLGERPVPAMLDCAKRANLGSVLIVGIDPKGQLFVSSSCAEWRDILWLIRKAEWFVQRQVS